MENKNKPWYGTEVLVPVDEFLAALNLLTGANWSFSLKDENKPVKGDSVFDIVDEIIDNH